jgi:meiotically up-regulated gene 157 (Mug157) protein
MTQCTFTYCHYHYLGAIQPDSSLYLNTRVVLSENNPFFMGKAGEGVGGPHTGADTIWPMSIILERLPV